ncbi:MAG: amidohydrolase family protein [Spirochaetaceae bacterium]|nr:amidohydrolase family protein [Spirochaetaceae bacterium]
MIRGVDVFTGEPVELSIRGNRILKRTVLQSPHGLPFLSPGWFDLQVNGWRDLDWNSDELSLAQAEEMCRLLSVKGTTRFLATIITAPQEQLLSRTIRVRRFCEESQIVARSVAGIHVEGPYISSEDGPRGAHERSATRDPSSDELEQWIEASGDRIRMVTLAPERHGARGFITRLHDRGIIAALGHTAATAEQIRTAVDAGARFSTHLGNGLADEIHRHRNPIWPQLAEDRLTTGIIADGHHLPVEVIRAFTRAKGTDRIVVVSDAAAPGGNPPGTYRCSGIDVEVNEEGRIGLAGTPYLAGAGHLLDRAIMTLVVDGGLPIGDAAATITVNPHRLLGDAENEHSLEPGGRATLVCFHLPLGKPAAVIESVVVEGDVL